MAARKTTRKPAGKPKGKARRPAAKSGIGLIGWTAAAAIGVGWAASDGRLPALIHQWTAPERPVAASRPAPHAEPRQTVAVKPSRSTPRAEIAALPPVPSGDPRERTRMIHLPTPERTASIRPATAPVRPSVLVPAAMPLPGPRPATREALVPPAPVAAIAPAAPSAPVSGGERHATRALPLRPAPDGASAVLATIGTGTLVRVERAAGDWRYVRSVRGGEAGWTDGRYLAGEGGALAAAPAFAASREPRPLPLAPIGAR